MRLKVDDDYCFMENFNPRTPYGMRQSKNRRKEVKNMISIHAPLTGCDYLFR